MSVALPSEDRRSSDQPSGDVQSRARQRHAREGRSRNPIPEPEPVHLRDDTPDGEREAIDLHTTAQQRSTKQRRRSRIVSPERRRVRWYEPVWKAWRHHIRISVPHVDCRDHLANERTYLAYLRTSLALSMLGVVIAQLYRLQHSPTPSPVFGYFILSKPIASIFQGSAILMSLLGTIRFYRQQHAMSIGKVHAGGWEIYCVILFVLLLLVGMFGLHVAVNIYKEA